MRVILQRHWHKHSYKHVVDQVKYIGNMVTLMGAIVLEKKHNPEPVQD